MQTLTFPTKEELKKMPLYILRNIDVQNEQQEQILQEIVNEKVRMSPVRQAQLNRRDVPDIKTQEKEAHWQKIIDERTKALMPEQEEPEEEVSISEEEEEIENPVEDKKQFCNFCDSKGVRHKKNCTR